MFERVFKNLLHRFEKLSVPMEAFATLKQPRFFIDESRVRSVANIEIAC